MTQYNDHVVKWAVANYKAAEAEYRKMEAGMQRSIDMERQYRIAGRNAFQTGIEVLFRDARNRSLRWERMINWWGDRVAVAQQKMKRCFTVMDTVIFR